MYVWAISAPPRWKSSVSVNCQSYTTAPIASGTLAVNACASPTTDGPECVTLSVRADADADAQIPAHTISDRVASDNPRAGLRRSPISWL